MDIIEAWIWGEVQNGPINLGVDSIQWYCKALTPGEFKSMYTEEMKSNG